MRIGTWKYRAGRPWPHGRGDGQRLPPDLPGLRHGLHRHEMVSAKAIQYGDKKSRELADLSHDQGPVFLQIFGDDPQVMAGAAQSLLDLGPAGFDINMGCPVPKVAGNGCGSALMKDPQRCGEIVAAVKAAVPVPVTAKMRWAGTRNTKTWWRWPVSVSRPGPTPSASTAAPGTRCTPAKRTGRPSAR